MGPRFKAKFFKMEFGVPQLPGGKGLAAHSFLQGIGPPPRSRDTPQKVASQVSPQPARVQTMVVPEDEPFMQPTDEGFQSFKEHAAGLDQNQILLQQSQALTALVAHMASQEGSLDLGGTSSSSSLTLKGSAKRDKLLSDLASRRGDFMLKVAQNAFKRMKPSERLPKSLDELGGGKALFTKYLERHGGYAGAKDMGLIMWLLAHISDLMLQNENAGAREMMALTMVSIEQMVQDGQKWDVAWLLSLQEDPPASMFTAKPASSNPRLRAFAPLCPPDWAATTLSYVKELDIISSRRQEVIPDRKSSNASSQKGQDQKEQSQKQQKQPRFPKKPKKPDDQASSQS